MAKKKILVLTDKMPWGHRSIAKAIFGYLKPLEKSEGWEVNYADVKLPVSALNDIYIFFYRFMPLMNKLAYKVMEIEAARKIFVEALDSDLPDLVKQIKKYQPDIIISTYFVHSHALVKWKKENKAKFKLWSVVTDPWTINAVSFVPEADLSIAYDDVSIKQGKKLGMKEEDFLKTGWWVRGEMYDKKYRTPEYKAESRKRLGFTDDRPVAFVGGGSLGNSALSKFLPVLLAVKRPIGVVFNTGTDKLAYSMIEEYMRLFKKLRKDNFVQVKNLGWIENMAEVLSACDIVFGKAGPNFLFDCTALEKPFVAITHVGGQEDGNIDLIKKKKIGWIRERGNHAAEFLLNYVENPKKFEKMYLKNIKSEADYNERSMPALADRLREELK